MNADELKARTKQFALRVMTLIDSLPNTTKGRVVANQLMKAATSVGANYRAACRGRSQAEFISKLSIVLEESDECCYWLELIMEGGLIPAEHVADLYREADEITAIMTASHKTACNNR
ncbi:MAG: four helix bundle protein [Kiritimatiellaceae bacterium]|nr:four helix bundle protein [Kiritimatiellaceae bacterium]